VKCLAEVLHFFRRKSFIASQRHLLQRVQRKIQSRAGLRGISDFGYERPIRDCRAVTPRNDHGGLWSEKGEQIFADVQAAAAKSLFKLCGAGNERRVPGLGDGAHDLLIHAAQIGGFDCVHRSLRCGQRQRFALRHGWRFRFRTVGGEPDILDLFVCKRGARSSGLDARQFLERSRGLRHEREERTDEAHDLFDVQVSDELVCRRQVAENILILIARRE